MAEQKMCPSATGDTPDAQIIGFIGADGAVGTIAPPVPLTKEVREAVGSQPEAKFRLAGRCTQSQCSNWQDEACALIDRMREQVDRLHPGLGTIGKLQRCAIRSACVWWGQSGPDACRVCPFVIYNPSE
jgi:hypothetical protein